MGVTAMTQHVRVPYALLDLDESNETKYVFIALLRFRSGYSKNIKVSLKRLTEVTGLKPRQLTNHINRLIDRRMILRKQTKHNDGHYGCNTYTITCEESKFAAIPMKIAFHERLSVSAIIGYCVLKRYINLNDGSFACFATKEMMAEEWRCSLNQVDKVKRNLKAAGLIDYEHGDKKIGLCWEYQLHIGEAAKTVIRINNVKVAGSGVNGLAL
jgi:hypothetical protein